MAEDCLNKGKHKSLDQPFVTDWADYDFSSSDESEGKQPNH